MAVPSDNTMRIFRQTIPGESQLWPVYVEDVISEIVPGGSQLINFIPSLETDAWSIDVGHLSGIWGEGFDGSKSYMEYITDDFTVAADPAECDWGEGAVEFAQHTYSLGLKRISTSSKNHPLGIFDGGGMKQHASQPSMPRIRGEFAGNAITNDRDWIAAMQGKLLHDHVNWMAINGDEDIPSKMGMADGLDKIFSTGWVNNHIVGTGSAPFSDPMVSSGVALTTPATVLAKIQMDVWRVYNRMRSRGYIPRLGDIAIAMPTAFWRQLAAVISVGLLMKKGTVTGIDVVTNPEVIQREYDRITNWNDMFGGAVGQFGGFIPFDGFNVPVILDDNLGKNSTVAASGNPAVTGDIYTITRSAFGQSILEQRYINYNNIPDAVNPKTGEKPVIFMDGMIRAKWVPTTTTQECWYWAMDMHYAIASYMQWLQCKITDVTLEMDADDTVESGSWTHPNYHLFEGADGGAGNALLVPTNT